jgi:hypothetical protein
MAAIILEKQNRLQMSQVFSVSAHLSLSGFAFKDSLLGNGEAADIEPGVSGCKRFSRGIEMDAITGRPLEGVRSVGAVKWC